MFYEKDLRNILLRKEVFLSEIISNKESINLKTENRNQRSASLLLIIIILEWVLGGSGRLITFGSFFSIRYIIFLIAGIYFILKCEINNFKIRKDLFYFDVFLFFYVFIFAIANGILSGYEVGNVIKSSQGYLYLLMYFPLALLINNKRRVKQIFWLFINGAVVLALITLTIFILFYFNHSMGQVLSPILNKLDYGYIALRGGLPAVFLKSSPLVAIAFILLLIQFINLKKELNIKNFIKILVLFFGILATMSMGIWIATFVGVLLAIAISKRKYRLMGLVAVFLLICFAYFFLSDYINIALTNRLSSSDSSSIIKFDQLITLLQTWSDRLIFGNGFGIEITFSTILGTRTMINFELFWLQLLVNMGLIGFIVYIKIFVKSIYYSIKISKKIPFKDALLIKSLIVGLVMLSIISSVNPFLNNSIGIGYLIIVLATISVYFRDLKNEVINK